MVKAEQGYWQMHKNSTQIVTRRAASIDGLGAHSVVSRLRHEQTKAVQLSKLGLATGVPITHGDAQQHEFGHALCKAGLICNVSWRSRDAIEDGRHPRIHDALGVVQVRRAHVHEPVKTCLRRESSALPLAGATGHDDEEFMEAA
eukprot:5591421-Pleurochrysis_carterae.AAC.1